VRVKEIPEVTIPKITYPSAACAIVNAGGQVGFDDRDWQQEGWYYLKNAGIIDSAKYLCRGMYWNKEYPHASTYFRGCFVCLSFHAKKAIPIGRGGAILTGNKKAYEWFKCARFDGRHEAPLNKDTLAMAGWNMYMTPEQAARGLELMQWIKDVNILPPDPYQDLLKYDFFTKANR